ncbi:MAG: beta-ketoacyl-ACP synthase 3, partial [Deltaproteobacteria bacterium]|nr:beta-ketoacyl-ACP synthase 3 [Deltaproteobacteria bacterium]
RLGLRSGIPALDVSAACSGFLYALDVADKYIRLEDAKNVLVIGVDLFSRVVDWTDRSTCVLFGDGAGAAVLKAESNGNGILSTHMHSDGRHGELLYAPMDIKEHPFSVKDEAKADDNGSKLREPSTLKMRGNEIFKIAVRSMNGAIMEALDSNGLKAEDITLLVPHQANTRIIKAMKDRLDLPDGKIFVNISKYGNTSAASIPIALDEAFREGRIKDGDIVIMVAFGGGLTWGSVAVRW